MPWDGRTRLRDCSARCSYVLSSRDGLTHTLSHLVSRYMEEYGRERMAERFEGGEELADVGGLLSFWGHG